MNIHYINVYENINGNSDKSLIHLVTYLFTYLFPTPPAPPKEDNISLLSECCQVLAQSFTLNNNSTDILRCANTVRHVHTESKANFRLASLVQIRLLDFLFFHINLSSYVTVYY